MPSCKKVAIIMGSDSDLPIVKGAISTLKELEIPVEVHVMSAHRTPSVASDFATNAGTMELVSLLQQQVWRLTLRE